MLKRVSTSGNAMNGMLVDVRFYTTILLCYLLVACADLSCDVELASVGEKALAAFASRVRASRTP